MTQDRRRLVVIGGGVAGATAAHFARGEYIDAEITLFSREPAPYFYNKIALNSVITGSRQAEDLRVLAPDWLEDQGIECRWGEEVASLSPDEGRLRTEGGEVEGFDRLILATGAAPFRPPVPGIDGPGVLHLWSLQDALELRGRLVGAEAVTVIGGGVLGVETALDLTKSGLEVALVEARDRLMPDLLDDEASALLSSALRERGVAVHLDAAVERVESPRGRTRLSLGSGEAVEGDLAILVAGVRPNISLARAAGIETRRGIVVDEQLRTSHPRVLAAGNCVELEGARAMHFLWNPARGQGEVAGLNAFSAKRSAPGRPPSLHAKTPGLPLFACGRTIPEAPGDQLIQAREGDSYRALRIDRAGHLVGAICLGDISGYYALERAIYQGELLPEALRARGEIAPIIESLSPPATPDEYLQPNWVCQMCGFNVEGEHPPGVCPICGVGRDQFLVA